LPRDDTGARWCRRLAHRQRTFDDGLEIPTTPEAAGSGLTVIENSVEEDVTWVASSSVSLDRLSVGLRRPG
jgi:hypothetical protein